MEAISAEIDICGKTKCENGPLFQLTVDNENVIVVNSHKHIEKWQSDKRTSTEKKCKGNMSQPNHTMANHTIWAKKRLMTRKCAENRNANDETTVR